jgi:hypothetical protein
MTDKEALQAFARNEELNQPTIERLWKRGYIEADDVTTLDMPGGKKSAEADGNYYERPTALGKLNRCEPPAHARSQMCQPAPRQVPIAPISLSTAWPQAHPPVLFAGPYPARCHKTSYRWGRSQRSLR